MSLSREERKLLADEARKLAMECVEGGPKLVDQWCGCAISLCLKRAGLWEGAARGEDLARSLESEFSPQARPGWVGTLGTLSVAVRMRAREEDPEPTAVVFPLLAWADELSPSEAA